MSSMPRTTKTTKQTAKCCMCKKPTPIPAHDSLVQTQYMGWAPGRYRTVRAVYCAPCWTELERANRKYHEDLMAATDKIVNPSDGMTYDEARQIVDKIPF